MLVIKTYHETRKSLDAHETHKSLDAVFKKDAKEREHM